MRIASLLPDFLRAPDLPTECRPTYVRHFSFAVLDAMAAGIIANAPLMALKGMASSEWQVAVQLPISSVGMFLVLYLGGVMARRRPMPFAVVPGMVYAFSSLAMAMANEPLLFLVLGGLGTLFETVSRPAVTAIIRLNYPATQRGAVTGIIRQWHLITFLITGALAAWSLDVTGDSQTLMIKGQMVVAGLVSAVSFLVFRTIRVREPQAPPDAADAGAPSEPFREAWRIVRGDRRFRTYLAIGFLYAFGALLYVSYLPVLFSRRLQFGYLVSALLTNTLPNLLAILCTGHLGRWMDRVNTWKAWAVIRLGWGVDPLLLAGAAWLAGVHPLLEAIPAVLGRVSRGLVLGGSWILWWQVGVNHFAKPGGDTSRYLGLILFVNGLARLLGPSAGAWMLQAHCSLGAIFGVGGILVLMSSALSWVQSINERGDQGLSTIAAFEATHRARPCHQP
jgi:hypothetical protein